MTIRGGVTPAAADAAPASAPSVYDELGVRTLIHAAGTKTTHGGSRMRPEVLDAMVEASRSFVSIEELNRAVGRYVASVTGAEAGMVTSGAGSGVVLSLAACMTGTDVVKVRRLPDTTGMKDEVVVFKVHRGRYSHMYTFTGARMVEAGNVNDCLAEEVAGAISERTAAVAYLFGPGIAQVGPTLSETVEIAHARGVPVIVDAAAMLPPKRNLWRYVDDGADLVTISGGKLIHGPQATGLLFGRADLVEAALANASPNHAIGRPHKVSREDMVGLYVALKLYLEEDEAHTLTRYRRRLLPVLDALRAIPGVRATIEHDDFKYHVPQVVLQLPDDWAGPPVGDVARALLDGEPSIFVLFDRARRVLTVNPVSLQDGEAEIVARRLREELEAR